MKIFLSDAYCLVWGVDPFSIQEISDSLLLCSFSDLVGSCLAE